MWRVWGRKRPGLSAKADEARASTALTVPWKVGRAEVVEKLFLPKKKPSKNGLVVRHVAKRSAVPPRTTTALRSRTRFVPNYEPALSQVH